jgi:hypothetical protein
MAYEWNKEDWDTSSDFFKSKYPFENGPIHNAAQWGPIFFEELEDWNIVIKSIKLIQRSITIPSMSVMANIERQLDYWDNLIKWIEETKINFGT